MYPSIQSINFLRKFYLLVVWSYSNYSLESLGIVFSLINLYYIDFGLDVKKRQKRPFLRAFLAKNVLWDRVSPGGPGDPKKRRFLIPGYDWTIWGSGYMLSIAIAIDTYVIAITYTLYAITHRWGSKIHFFTVFSKLKKTFSDFQNRSAGTPVFALIRGPCRKLSRSKRKIQKWWDIQGVMMRTG